MLLDYGVREKNILFRAPVEVWWKGDLECACLRKRCRSVFSWPLLMLMLVYQIALHLCTRPQAQ